MSANRISPDDARLFKELEKRGLKLDGTRSRLNAITFKDFVNRVNPKYVWHKHCEVLADVAQRIIDGKLNRVICMMPFRHSKSETMTRLLGSYHVYRFPERWVGLVSYSSGLAHSLSSESLAFYRKAQGPLSPLANAKKHWETGQGGGMWATGMEGPITGKGFDLGIIDDPIRDQAEAMSETIREGCWNWFQSVFLGREQANHAKSAAEAESDNPAGSILITLTRWHEQDIVGKLITLAKDAEANPDLERDELPDPWHVVCFPALAEDLSRYEFPENWTIEKDWREPGQPLCPVIKNSKRLQKMKATLSPYQWSSLWQQRPTSAQGEKFNLEHFRYWRKVHKPSLGDMIEIARKDEQPEYVSLEKCSLFATVDSASSLKSDADYSCIMVFAKTPSGNLILVHRLHGRFTDPAFLEQAKNLRERFFLQKTPIQAFYVEKNGPGLKVAQNFTAAGIPTIPTQTVLDKVSRASTAIIRIEAGQIFFPLGAPWLEHFEFELLHFPRGAHDDQVDCLSLAAEKTFGPSLVSVITDSASAARNHADRSDQIPKDFEREIPDRFQRSPYRINKEVARALFGERN